ncbi:MAG: deoxyribose-phosphate aldolase [candidate division Zixibacteria bacterium]|jgi:deoxyribose-phosphate aldolase|nr:deoxyribose-phosphate aldolase [candidate division Zixibacteria bacterium]
MRPSDLAGLFDHTNLRSDTTELQIRTLCAEARTYRFAAVCVNPVWVTLACDLLADTDISVAATAGFPLGATKTEIKVAECLASVDDGANEIDLVANIGWLASDRFVEAESEIRKVRRNLPSNVILKVIIECNLLDPGRWPDAAKAVANAGAEFVKTGTGFAGPVTDEQVRLLHAAVGDRIKLKAAGGIRTLSQARLLIDSGASRLGCSSTVSIIQEASRPPEP